jgi:carboxypeptidase C (cathepsin A)
MAGKSDAARMSVNRALLAVFLLLAASVLPARADDSPAAVPPDLPTHVETEHTIVIGDRTLDYRAIAETLPLRNDKGDTTASIYTMSYLSRPATGTARPVAFVFNGGPGAASVFLHLGALGPRVLETPVNGAPPGPPVRLIDNPATWLAFTDLVFVDPVGTGFSRGKGKEDNPDKPFWGVRSDLNALTSLVRLWLTRYMRWASPVYLVGESYGGYRAAALARTLDRDAGVTVTGLVLVSPALNTALLHPDITNLIAPAVQLPSYAVVSAALSGKPQTTDDTAATERFALSEYLVGLAGLAGQPAENDPFIGRVTALVGLPEEVVRRERGRVSKEIFARELRKPQNEILSLYDGTLTRPAKANPWDDQAGDPGLDPAVSALTQAFGIYAPETLGYRTDLAYRVLPREVSRQWDWDSSHEREGGLGLPLAGLESMLLAHPDTAVMIAHGRYDLVTPYLASRWLVDQLSLPGAVREKIRLRVYEGGHMMYLRPQSRTALAADAADLFASRHAAQQ